ADRAHQFEHSLEVQLPFLQVALDKFQIIPLLVGMAKSEQVAEVLALLWGGPETLILVTSDLSHHHDHVTAARLDRRTAEVIESLQGQELTGRRACGFRPIQGLLDVARTRG